MESFVKDLTLDNVLLKVHFNEINGPNGIRYFVFARDLDGNTHSFNMERDGNKWRIINAPKVSDLLLNHEGRLSDAINDHLKSIQS